jgi:hypothetical protein
MAHRLVVGAEHSARTTRLQDGDGNRVRDDVVQLARDGGTLRGDCATGLLFLLLLDPGVLRVKLAYPLLAEPDHQARGPGSADQEQPEDDVADLEGVPIGGNEVRHAHDDEHD